MLHLILTTLSVCFYIKTQFEQFCKLCKLISQKSGLEISAFYFEMDFPVVLQFDDLNWRTLVLPSLSEENIFAKHFNVSMRRENPNLHNLIASENNFKISSTNGKVNTNFDVNGNFKILLLLCDEIHGERDEDAGEDHENPDQLGERRQEREDVDRFFWCTHVNQTDSWRNNRIKRQPIYWCSRAYTWHF